MFLQHIYEKRLGIFRFGHIILSGLRRSRFGWTVARGSFITFCKHAPTFYGGGDPYPVGLDKSERGKGGLWRSVVLEGVDFIKSKEVRSRFNQYFFRRERTFMFSIMRRVFIGTKARTLYETDPLSILEPPPPLAQFAAAALYLSPSPAEASS